jgi:hypothetical protein
MVSPVYTAAVAAVLVVLGSCQNAVASVVFEYAVEVAYPIVGEDVSAGWFMWLTHAFGTISLVSAPYILPTTDSTSNALLFLKQLLGCCCLSFVIIATVTREYRRLAYEKVA